LEGKAKGFKIDASHPEKDCFYCTVNPPPPNLSGKAIRSLGANFCKIPLVKLSDEELQKKPLAMSSLAPPSILSLDRHCWASLMAVMTLVCTYMWILGFLYWAFYELETYLNHADPVGSLNDTYEYYGCLFTGDMLMIMLDNLYVLQFIGSVKWHCIF
jgi:hypothetical protein